ncbi:hypothetical protein Tco_1026854, partial [Tanacetum coccineum]
MWTFANQGYGTQRILSIEDKERCYADIKVLNYILQGIPTDIYNSVDACQDAQAMWKRVKRLMQGTDLSERERHLRLMNEFDKFSAEASESLTYVYEKNTWRITRNQTTNAENGFAQKNVEINENAQRNPRPTSTLVQMLLAAKYEAKVHVVTKENDFMLMSAYGDDQLEELNALVIMMARIQPTDNESDAEPTYDAEVISELNASQINLINGLLSKEVNGGQLEHDQDAHDQNFAGLESLINNVQVEVENQHRMNNELEKQNALIKRELE